MSKNVCGLIFVVEDGAASCAVDGVKVDAQAMATMLGSERGGSLQTTSKFIKAMEKSVVR
eukprot:3022860-Rhodomonas_salina.1